MLNSLLPAGVLLGAPELPGARVAKSGRSDRILSAVCMPQPGPPCPELFLDSTLYQGALHQGYAQMFGDTT